MNSKAGQLTSPFWNGKKELHKHKSQICVGVSQTQKEFWDRSILCLSDTPFCPRRKGRTWKNHPPPAPPRPPARHASFPKTLTAPTIILRYLIKPNCTRAIRKTIKKTTSPSVEFIHKCPISSSAISVSGIFFSAICFRSRGGYRLMCHIGHTMTFLG